MALQLICFWPLGKRTRNFFQEGCLVSSTVHSCFSETVAPKPVETSLLTCYEPLLWKVLVPVSPIFMMGRIKPICLWRVSSKLKRGDSGEMPWGGHCEPTQAIKRRPVAGQYWDQHGFTSSLMTGRMAQRAPQQGCRGCKAVRSC